MDFTYEYIKCTICAILILTILYITWQDLRALTINQVYRYIEQQNYYSFYMHE